MDSKTADDSASSTEGLQRSRNSSRRGSAKLTRTTFACTRCRQRRTKCSGMPAPCDLCRKDNEYCHFHPRLDSRRKQGLSTTDVASRRRSILQGLLLALKSNPYQEVHGFLNTIRSQDNSPLDMANSLEHQIRIAFANSRVSAPELTQDDLIALAILDMPSDSASKQSLKYTSDGNMQQQLDGISSDHFPESSMGSSERSLPASGRLLRNHPSLDQAITHQPVDSTTSLYQQSLSPPALWAADDRSIPPSHVKDGFPKAEAHSLYSAVEGKWSVQSAADQPLDVISIQSKYTSFDLPFSPPILDFSRLWFSLRDSARYLLAQGVPLSNLIGSKNMNCELLFRDRTPADVMNISNWACEVARRLPYLPISTRIALALCFARIMPYLLVPCQKTWEALPEALRPTEPQFSNSHDITTTFCPIPVFRSLLSHDYVNWLEYASQHNLKFTWSGIWGDVDEAFLTEVGNWRQPIDLRGSIDLSFQTDPQESHSRRLVLSETKAIVRDPRSGQPFVSDEFERQCWIPDNWRFDKSVLQVWPELHEYARYLQEGTS